jgi:hypothetical protein
MEYPTDIATRVPEGISPAKVDELRVSLSRHPSADRLGQCGHSNGIIGEEREGPLPCSDRRRLLPPLDCCRSDARSDMARTSPTSDARCVSSRSGRGALLSRGGVLLRLQRPWPAVASSSTRGREAASGSPEAASHSRPDPRTRQTSSRNDLAGRAR